MNPLVPTHEYTAPHPGHPDFPNGCAECGYGPMATQHPQPDALAGRITAATAIGRDLRAELVDLVGEYRGQCDHVLALCDGRVAALLAALGGVDPAPFLIAGRRPTAPNEPAVVLDGQTALAIPEQSSPGMRDGQCRIPSPSLPACRTSPEDPCPPTGRPSL